MDIITISDSQREELRTALKTIKPNPYTNTKEFKLNIRHLIDSNQVPNFFVDMIERRLEQDHLLHPFHYIVNMPIDNDLPLFGNEHPVEDKRRLKCTFISESLLELYGQMTGTQSIGYKFVNEGDVYQDIFPMKRLWNTQSQKALNNIGFHKDLANHFVRPDYVNIIALRNSKKNKVCTTFVRNYDVLNCLSATDIELLGQKIYFTPFDDLTKFGDKSDTLGKAELHTVIYDQYNLAYFEGRTRSDVPEGMQVIKKLNDLLHSLKEPIHLLPGEFISSENNLSIHGKEVIHIGDEEELKKRWLMKTVNIFADRSIQQHLAENSEFVVKG